MDIVEKIADLGYELTHGLPAYWGNDKSGILPRAVSHLMAYGTGDGSELTDEDMKYLIEYAQYFIQAPCWDAVDTNGEIDVLRKKASELKTVDDIMQYVTAALDAGIDPF